MVSSLGLIAWLLGWFHSRLDWLDPLTLVVSGADAILKDALNVAMLSCSGFPFQINSFCLVIFIFHIILCFIFPGKEDASGP